MTRVLGFSVVAIVLVGALALFGSGVLTLPTPAQSSSSPPTTSTTTNSGPQYTTWSSGVWTGGQMNAAAATEFGVWRGNPTTVVTSYPDTSTWAKIADSKWHLTTFDGFAGKIAFGVPLLPKQAKGSTLTDVAAGEHDDAFTTIATNMRDTGRGDSYVRLGWEANGTWMPWGGTVETRDDFIAAFRHVSQVMKGVAPDLVMVFDITCGSPMEGNDNRLSSLTELYPGDDVVDVIGCDFYDQYQTKATNDKEWETAAVMPARGPGLPEVAQFARDHNKRFAIPEWGLASKRGHGNGDNPYFIKKMHEFFVANADILEFENYFNEPDVYIGSAIWDSEENPRSAARYKELWGDTGPTTPAETPTAETPADPAQTDGQPATEPAATEPAPAETAATPTP